MNFSPIFHLRPSFLVFFGAVVATSAVSPMAHADDASNEAAAQALFDQARDLMAKGDYAHACPKFSASQKLDPGAGTLLDLANCYEKNGQTASAWASYKDAAAAAQVSGRKDWAKQADEGAAALTPKLSRLTVHAPAPASAVAGTIVKRDGTAMNKEELDLALPLDPGAHTIDASAPGKTPFHADVTIGPNADAKDVTIPPLSDAAPAAPAAMQAANAATPAPHDSSSAGSASGLRTAGYIVGALGVVGLGVGVVAALVSHTKNGSATDICPNSGPCASVIAVNDANSAHNAGNIATVGFIAGGALLAGGLAMILLAPKSEDAPGATALHVTPWIDLPRVGSAAAGGFGLGGSFK